MSKLHLHALMVLILFMGVDLSAQKELLMVEDRSFRHPGLYQNQEDLAHMRKMIKDQIEPFFSAFKRLSEQADLDFDPQPVSHVVRGSYGRGSIGGDEFRASARASYQHALMWELTGDKTYANKAIEIINAWTPVIWDFDGNDAKVIIGWAIHEFCNAAELLRYSDSGWEADDIASFEKTLLTIYYPVIEHFFPEANGNWDGAIINSMMSIGVFCDRKDIYNRAVSHYLRGPVNGGFTRYFYPNGQCQENTRDQIHTQMGLDYFAKACQIAWTQGSDLYELANNRLALAFEFTSKYMAGHEVNAYGTISEKARDRYRDNFHAPFYHYTRVKGLSMPYTSISVDSTLAKSTVEFLSAIRAPIETVNPVSEEPQPYPMVGFRGAKFESTTNPPSDAIRVRPGDSIQAAIDLASINGKWVVLEEGVHHISSSLQLRSNLTLTGVGSRSVVFMEPGSNDFVMVNAERDMHEVLISDLVIECALSVETSSDPNQDRRHRSVQVAPKRGGIRLAGVPDSLISDITLQNLTLRHATHHGISISGGDQIQINNCNLEGNGGSITPGVHLLHNLHLAHVSSATIRNCRLVDSPWGCGIDLSFSSDIGIHTSEIARNGYDGIRLTECNDIRILENLIEGNTNLGIHFEQYDQANRNIGTQQNIIHFNGKALQDQVISILHSHHNQVTENGTDFIHD